MAMDKEKFLSYFQDHYLSRQEVLFKFPLNYSIDTFWPELLARRKNRATLLPLYNAASMPYQYARRQWPPEGVFVPFRRSGTKALPSPGGLI